MSIKKIPQSPIMPSQVALTPETTQAKSQSLQDISTQAGVPSAGQNVFEAGTLAVQAQAPTSTAQVSGGQVTSVLQQAISQLAGVDGVAGVPGLGAMSRTEIQALEVQTDHFLDHIQGLAEERPEVLRQSLEQVFGAKVGQAAIDQLVSQAQDGDFPLPGQIQFVDSEVLRGADAAYAEQSGGTILVNRSLLDRPARLQIALTEEIGHHLDQILGGGDSIGDEGELFQRAMAKGGPLSSLELRAGKFDSDKGAITLQNGQTMQVEFRSDKTARYYEAQGSVNEVDMRNAGRLELRSAVYERLFAKFSTADAPIESVTDLRKHLRQEGLSIVTERIAMENTIFEELTGTTHDQSDIDAKMVHKFRKRTVNGHPITTVDDVRAYCEANGRSFTREVEYAERGLWYGERQEHTESLGQTIVLDAQAATLIAKLKRNSLLGETANLGTNLPFEVLERVGADPVLSQEQPPIETYGQLFKALASDVDGDGRSDFDALLLGRFLPAASQQDILKALDHPIDNADLKDQLRGAGFEHELLDTLSERGALSIDPPKAFGLDGFSEVSRTQQQLLLRTGQIFMDSNEDGKVDDNDVLQYIDEAGSVRETTYGELNSDLKKLVKYNIATSKACEDYAALPSWNRMKFPHYSSSTGESAPEKVNEDFWSVSKAEANNGQISWELNNDTKPSDALNDIFNGNGGQYTTECAQGRTLLRLKGLNNYYMSEFGKGEGSFRFNALFAKGSADKSRASEYLEAFDAFQQANPDKGWDDFTAERPMPEMQYALEVSRHVILGDNEAIIQPWQRVNSESAAGDTGYFHNYSVSVEGVKIGYVGENVIDLGYQNGVRMYWGHPGGIQTEDKWSEELGSQKIAVHSMSEYSEYFSSLDITRGSARVTRERVADLRETNTELEQNKPAGWEAQVEQNNNTIGWWEALDVARQSIATDIDPAKADEAHAFFEGAGITNRPESFDALYDTLSPEGITSLSEALPKFGEGTIDSVLNYFGKSEIEELSEKERATTTLLLTLAQSGRMHPVLQEEGLRSIDAIHFQDLSSWIEPGGHMASKEAFQSWLSSDAFPTWYQEEAGIPYNGETDLSKMTLADVQELVEMVFPMTKGKRTIYAEVNRGQQELSAQMATLLKDGKLPEAAYALDSNPVSPLD